MKLKSFFAIVASTMFIASCQKDLKNGTVQDQPIFKAEKLSQKTTSDGKVYTLSNDATKNEVLVYNRSVSGELSFAAAYDAGGEGTGAGLANQGAIAFSDDDNLLFAINAGSNTISSFKISGNGLQLISTIWSGGSLPKSITSHGSLVYVLNAGGEGNISGFRTSSDGVLTAIANSTRPLSSIASDPAQISFVTDGAAVAVTEKAENKIITYTISDQGIPGALHSVTSANTTPFGFAVGDNGIIYVSEAAGGAQGATSVSSYSISSTGEISLLNGPVLTGETSACWVAINNSNRYVYASNTASNSISSFTAKGTLQVLQAAITPASAPADASFSSNSKFLYVRNGGNHTVSGFAVNSDGSLVHIQDIANIPASATGLAAQ